MQGILVLALVDSLGPSSFDVQKTKRSFSSGQDAVFYMVSVIAVLPSAKYHIANDVCKRLQLWLKRAPAAGGSRRDLQCSPRSRLGPALTHGRRTSLRSLPC